jgi:hypothetical protein
MDHRTGRRTRAREESGRKKKLIEHAEWRFGEQGEVASAAAASAAAARRRAQALGVPYAPKFDAAALQPPALMTENVDAWELFSSCQSQLITAGLGTIVGVSQETLKWKMDLLQIPPDEQLETVEKFELLAEIFVKSCAARSTSKSESKSAIGG